VHYAIITFIQLCANSFCRTDSALKFGWFFFAYLVISFMYSFPSWRSSRKSLICCSCVFHAVSHWLLHLCCCCSPNCFQGEISCVSFSFRCCIEDSYFARKLNMTWLCLESETTILGKRGLSHSSETHIIMFCWSFFLKCLRLIGLKIYWLYLPLISLLC
jgi:hypothetical protein